MLGIAVRERAEEDAVDDAEDGGGRTDTEGKSEDRDGGEDRRFAKHAKTESEVLEKSFEEWEGAVVADEFFGLLRATEPDQSLAAGFLRGHAGFEVVGDSFVDVGGHLGFEVGVEGVATEEGGHAIEEAKVHKRASIGVLGLGKGRRKEVERRKGERVFCGGVARGFRRVVWRLTCSPGLRCLAQGAKTARRKLRRATPAGMTPPFLLRGKMRREKRYPSLCSE